MSSDVCKEDPVNKNVNQISKKRKPSQFFFDADTSSDANVDEGPSKNFGNKNVNEIR
jgi:hypothetical protein